MNVLRSVWRAACYEATRLRTLRTTYGVLFLAVLGSALVTLPAARAAVNSGRPQGHVAWVVAGGFPGRILPGTVAVLAGALLGAGLVTEDYHYGLGLTTLTRLPRRGAGLCGKLLVALAVGLTLAAVTRLSAYLTALGGFSLAHASYAAHRVDIPFGLVLATPAESFLAAFGAALGVLYAPLLRWRLLAVPAAWVTTAILASLAPGSHSPYTRMVALTVARVGLPVEQSAIVLPEVLVLGLLGAALYAVRRRRVD